MVKKSLDQIVWATPEKPHGLWAYCVICEKDIRELRTRKNTCSDECHALKVKDIDRKSYANQMAKDPDYAKKQSAKQYSRIKADPNKMEAKRIAQNERMQMPSYKESSQKSHKKYRSNPKTKQLIAKRMRKYRDENPEIIAEIERRRIAKRSEERKRLKIENPEKFAELQQHEREKAAKRKAEKRFAELQKDLEKLVTNDE
ncbi:MULTISPECIES: hypothetical protein [Acinetobacter]|uniref:Uncharacterized protein n=1 Tax=Acinetobacter indicus TaxID=756892 RepID=A0A6C0Y8Z2_9GAMM|nr:MULTISPECIES: hypothetical protein [Acinetobacter]QIC72065.1 hypothetical protein FSC09_17050 [Acinetobacter indicus]QKQ71534.1 hypothetical protein E5Y90_14980 [Acinetobacter sp. 10FS3-1]